VVCAAPDYLARHGTPRSPTDLDAHDTIGFASTAPDEWPFVMDGRTVAARPPSRLIVNTADVAIAAAVAGRGLTRVLSYMIEPELHAGRLQLVLPEFELPPIPVHLVQPAGRRASARVRAFVDFAAERLRTALAPR
jgi:DNA-binding transcriptional LysR family regulator